MLTAVQSFTGEGVIFTLSGLWSVPVHDVILWGCLQGKLTFLKTFSSPMVSCGFSKGIIEQNLGF